MNELMIQNLAHTVGSMKETMSSLEIARLTGKEHSNVMRDIRVFLEAIGQEKMASEIEAIYTDAYGRDKPCYNLPKRECLGLAARYDVNLQMAIIDRWAELEAKEQQALIPMDKERATLDLFGYRVEKSAHVADLLGYSQGYKRKEALEIGIEMEQETGIRVCPNFLLNDKDALAPDSSLDPKLGTHAALVATGTLSYTPSYIASLFPSKGITGTRINEFLCKTGLQTKKGPGRYIPTAKGKMLCQESTRTSGPHKGETFIVQWLWQDNKTLRDIVETAVTSFLSARAPVVKKRPWERI